MLGNIGLRDLKWKCNLSVGGSEVIELLDGLCVFDVNQPFIVDAFEVALEVESPLALLQLILLEPFFAKQGKCCPAIYLLDLLKPDDIFQHDRSQAF